MKTILKAVDASITALIDNIKAATAALFAEANTRKAALAQAVANMQEVEEVLDHYTSSLYRLDEVIQAAEDIEHANTHISEMLMDMNVYEAPVEKFAGYCEECGDEMTIEDTIRLDPRDNEGAICESCYDNIPATAVED